MSSFYCEIPLDSDLQIVYYTSLATMGLATLVFLALWIWKYYSTSIATLKANKDSVIVCKHACVQHKGCDVQHLLKYENRYALVERVCDLSYTSITYGFIIFLLNTILYAVLLMEQGTIYNETLDLCVPWARWVVYTLSCTLLAYEIAEFQKMERRVKYVFVLTIGITLLTGAFSVLSVESLINRWIWFIIGGVTYLVALFLLFAFSDPCCKLDKFIPWVLPIFVLLTWTIYPIAYILGPNLLAVFGLTVESWIYYAGDLITKVFFGYYIARVHGVY